MVYNKIYAQLGEERHIVLDPINYQYDVKQILVISGETLTDYYEADICNVGDTATLTMIGTAADGVEIPDKFLLDGRNVLVYVVIPGSGGDVQTRYDITIPVDERAEREDIDPSEAEQQQIDSLINALNSGVRRAEAAATAAEESATDAEGSAGEAEDQAENAEAWAVGQRAGEDVPDTDQTYHNNSKYYAGMAEAAAEEAGRHEASWESWVRRAENAADDAEGSARAAAGAKADAEAAAKTANKKAAAAESSATEAENSAREAAQTVAGGVGAINTARDGALTAIGRAGTTQIGAVNQAGADQVTAVNQAGVTQVQAVEDKGNEVLDSIPQDYSDLADDVADLTRQLNDETNGLDSKAPVILETASGAIASFDDGADNMPVRKLVANIEPVQSGTGDPSPDNVRPISGWTGAEIPRTGINIWDEEWENGSISNETGQDVANSNIIRTKGYISVKPGLVYALVKPISSVHGLAFYDANKAFISYRTCNNSALFEQITTPDNCYYVRFRCITSYGATYNNDISINYPATDTEYHPYTGNQISVTFPSAAGTVYGGTVTLNQDRSVDLTNDTIIYDLSTAFTYYPQAYSASVAVRFGRGDENLSATPIDNVKSNILVTTTVSSLADRPQYSYYYKADNYYPAEIKLPPEYDTDAKVKAFFQDVDGNGTHAMLLVNRATPLTYHFSNIGQLKTFLGTNNVWADTGDVEVTYPADTKLYIDNKITQAIANALNS